MRALLIVFLLYAQTAFCQIKVRPVVEAGYGKNLMENFYSTNVLSAGTGIKLNERFYFQINFIQSKETQKRTYPNNPNDYYFNHVVSFSTSCRFLGNKNWISPSATFDIGNEIASNAFSPNFSLDTTIRSSVFSVWGNRIFEQTMAAGALMID